MPLSYRQRGRQGLWYARGTFRVAGEVVRLREYCTGARSRADAEADAEARVAQLRADILDGGRGRTRRLTIAHALEAYLRRPGGLQPYDVARVADLNARIGDRPLAEAGAAWSDYAAGRGWAPATARRHRVTLVAALRTLAEAEGLAPPRVPPVRRARSERDRVVRLPDALRERLLAAYHPVPACPVLLLAYAGLRTQEALRLDWRDVDLPRGRLLIQARKTRHPREVPMHRRVALLLWGLWESAGRPTHGPVFASARGRPYADTRGAGGNPLKRAHATACRRVGLTGFRLHDWRHDFAARFVAEGGDVRGLMQVMGWEDIRMARRYVVHTTEHLAALMQRVG